MHNLVGETWFQRGDFLVSVLIILPSDIWKGQKAEYLWTTNSMTGKQSNRCILVSNCLLKKCLKWLLLNVEMRERN